MCAAEVDHHVAQRYLLKRRLGKGAYGIVWKAVDRRTGEVVAIKKIFDAFRDKTDAQRTFREIMLLQEFGNHPNIIRLLDVIRAENDRDIYLVFEYMDTDLHAVICKGMVLKDTHKRYIFYQLLRATKFIHSGCVIHRDQKPSNVLLDASCSVKLCDFGLARSLSSLPEGPEGQALTEYVATRWYRAPEVLLSSSWYTPGVDMWSLGCILGEMLRGRPLFPGTSTLHQLELILETIPPPSEEDLLALGSSYSASVVPPLGSRFHCPAREWTLEAAVQLPVHEVAQLSATEYRNHVYQMVLERRGNSCLRRGKGLGADPTPQVQQIEPRADPQLPLGSRARILGPRPQSSPGHDPAHDAPRGAKNLLGQISAPLLQPPPPGGLGRGASPRGATAGFPLASSWAASQVKPSVKEVEPSLTSQAAAQVAIQALIRSDWNPGRGLSAAGARLVSHRPPWEARPEPRPGRRMFSASASQGAQGAARAALGGYSQAYGTVCQSALGCLPLLPVPRP
ncbi:mitogen-activated protein kinase 15 isoform X3 [Vicugna pacos]|uniref:Mitogen-activated protein kinase 15 isoform X3 n=1 Tax=Vicugna pacos TaxID=30538 RepID=A0ABM5CBG9_VICPA